MLPPLIRKLYFKPVFSTAVVCSTSNFMMSSLACGGAGVERSFLLSSTVLVLKKILPE